MKSCFRIRPLNLNDSSIISGRVLKERKDIGLAENVPESVAISVEIFKDLCC
jgi:hypothetical protein